MLRLVYTSRLKALVRKKLLSQWRELMTQIIPSEAVCAVGALGTSVSTCAIKMCLLRGNQSAVGACIKGTPQPEILQQSPMCLISLGCCWGLASGLCWWTATAIRRMDSAVMDSWRLGLLSRVGPYRWWSFRRLSDAGSQAF